MKKRLTILISVLIALISLTFVAYLFIELPLLGPMGTNQNSNASQPSCGNRECAPNENVTSCPQDCTCGNNLCESEKNENVTSCPQDCFCGDDKCELAKGETPTNCRADCYWEYSEHALKFFAFNNINQKTPFYPLNNQGNSLVELTIGDYAIPNTTRYQYASPQTINGNINVTNNSNDKWHYKKYLVYLTDQEAVNVFNGRSSIEMDKIQFADVKKKYFQDTGKVLKYGVVFDTNGNPVYQSGKPVWDSPIEEYWNGKTAVYPAPYNDHADMRRRFYWNYRNPSVVAYVSEFTKKSYEVSTWNFNATNYSYVDNNLWHNGAIREFLPPNKTSGDPNFSQAVLNYAIPQEQILDFLTNNNKKLILNGLFVDYTEGQDYFSNYIAPQLDYEAVMWEGRWPGGRSQHNGVYQLFDPLNSWSPLYTQINFLKTNNKKVLLTNIDHHLPQENTNLVNSYLYANLFAGGNKDTNKGYLFISYDISQPYENYWFYEWRFGKATTEKPGYDPVKREWSRCFVSGKEIVFHPAGGSSLNFSGLIDETAIWNRALSAAEIQAAYTKGNSGIEIQPENGLVSAWHFNGGGQNSVSENHAQLKGDTICNVQGKISQACLFEGNVGKKDYIEIIPDVQNRGKSITISMWVKPSSVPLSIQQIFGVSSTKGYFEDAATGSIQIEPAKNFVVYWQVNKTYTSRLASAPLTQAELLNWNHVALVFNANTGKLDLYRNGVLANTKTETPGLLNWRFEDIKIGSAGGTCYNPGTPRDCSEDPMYIYVKKCEQLITSKIH